MDQAQIDQQLKELRDQFPKMFNHKDARSNEVWVGDEILELAMMNEGIYRRAGLTTIRHVSFLRDAELGSGTAKVTHWAFFADAKEFVRLEVKAQEKK